MTTLILLVMAAFIAYMRSRRHSVNLYLDTSPIDLDAEGFYVAHARVLHEHAEVRHVLCPSAR